MQHTKRMACMQKFIPHQAMEGLQREIATACVLPLIADLATRTSH